MSIWNVREHSYGSLPVHEGLELWQSAGLGETSHSLLARLAVVHCVHEARGLDQAPRMLSQLQGYGDKASMHLLEVIERDELTHVSSGLKWFKFVCAAASPPLDPIPTSTARVVGENFRGSLASSRPSMSRLARHADYRIHAGMVKKERAPAAAALAQRVHWEKT